MSDSSPPPPRLLDPDAPTPPRLRALLTALLPGDPSDEADQRIEARIFQSLDEEPHDREPPLRLVHAGHDSQRVGAKRR
ncbi:MAG: hypothetical protein Q8S73_19270 [Deltaproteobacteria bacterium]|nr:hypothetical protein [Myxococcales bacterium]MDP3216258.1 hypothetical protein [Deltaproteobacteria bacterium]